MSLERIILKNLIDDEDYSRKVLPFLKEEYFSDKVNSVLFREIASHLIQYNTRPTVTALRIILDSVKDFDESQAKESIGALGELAKPGTVDAKWLNETTEKFCQDRALYLAMMTSIEVMNGKSKTLTKGAIPQLLTDALSISFDPNIGHDYLEQSDERFEFYHRVDEHIPFDIEFLNKITKNGLVRKTLNVALAGTHVGKSLLMCHMAAHHLTIGKNVLYITLEMAEERISERIDANLMNVALSDIENVPYETYKKKIEHIKANTKGKLIVKEYPMTTASVLHFKTLLNELKLKKGFKPDIIYIDYLNLVASSRYRPGKVGMYEYIKGVSEELRGFAVEQNLPVMTATQTNREGFKTSDVGMEHTAESFGLPMTADLMFSMTVSDELIELEQIQITQLKNRYTDMNINTRFTIGVDRPKMRLYDVSASAQVNITNSNQPPKTSSPKTDKFAGFKTS